MELARAGFRGVFGRDEMRARPGADATEARGGWRRCEVTEDDVGLRGLGGDGAASASASASGTPGVGGGGGGR